MQKEETRNTQRSEAATEEPERGQSCPQQARHRMSLRTRLSALHARANRGSRVVGVAFGNAVSFESYGTISVRSASAAERKRILIEEIGIGEELVSQLPEDIPTPPPPGSRKAQSLHAPEVRSISRAYKAFSP
jgi:hypothetical protein